MKLTLRKTRKYDLKPYGKFIFKWEKPKVEKSNQICVGEVSMYHDSAMPMTKEQENKFVKEMKKFKTDVFTDDEKFYTLTNSGMTEIQHKKLSRYKYDPAFKDAVDNETWR